MQNHAARTMSNMDGRRLDLDWVRIGAFALLILYHVGMFYVPWAWHVKSPRIVGWLEPVMALVNPWRLTLLFVVSGAATRFMADKSRPGRLAAMRSCRLLPPLLFGMAVIVPPQTWFQLAQAGAPLPATYGAFWLRYISASGDWTWHGAPLVTPTWNHLWFVVYLLAYTLLLAAALWIVPGAWARVQAAGERLLTGPGLLVWPVVWLVAVRMVLAPRFPETHAFAGDWTVHADSAPAFLFGFLFAKSDSVLSTFVGWRWRAFGIALAAYALYAAATICWPGDAVPPARLRWALRAIYGVDQWAWIAAVFGFARMHAGSRDGAVRRYLTDAIFPFYIVHQTIIVGVASTLAPLRLPLALEALVLIAASVGGCFASYEIVRRVRPLRPLFGLRFATPRKDLSTQAAGGERLALD